MRLGSWPAVAPMHVTDVNATAVVATAADADSFMFLISRPPTSQPTGQPSEQPFHVRLYGGGACQRDL